MDARWACIALLLLLAVVFTAACAMGASETAPALADDGGAVQQATAASLPDDPDGSMLDQGDANTIVSPDIQDTTLSPVPDDDMPGEVPGGAGEDAVLPGEIGEEEADVTWQIYHSATFMFVVAYPSVYVIVDAPDGAELMPQPVAQVHFQDRVLAEGDTAQFEPPQFAVDVFDNSAQVPLLEWLEQHELVGSETGWEHEAYMVGGVEGVRVCTRLMIAPNCFVYVANGGYVYRLTPLGTYGDEMVTRFRFGP